jgi:hypothetical protein
MQVLVSNIFSLVYSYSTLRLVGSYNVVDQVVAFLATCFKNILIIPSYLWNDLKLRQVGLLKIMGFLHEQVQLQVELNIMIVSLQLRVIWALQLIPHVE